MFKGKDVKLADKIAAKITRERTNLLKSFIDTMGDPQAVAALSPKLMLLADAYLVMAAILALNRSATNKNSIRQMLVEKSYSKIEKSWDKNGAEMFTEDLSRYTEAILGYPDGIKKADVIASTMLAESLISSNNRSDEAKQLKLLLARGFISSFNEVKEGVEKLVA